MQTDHNTALTVGIGLFFIPPSSAPFLYSFFCLLIVCPLSMKTPSQTTIKPWATAATNTVITVDQHSKAHICSAAQQHSCAGGGSASWKTPPRNSKIDREPLSPMRRAAKKDGYRWKRQTAKGERWLDAEERKMLRSYWQSPFCRGLTPRDDKDSWSLQKHCLLVIHSSTHTHTYTPTGC